MLLLRRCRRAELGACCTPRRAWALLTLWAHPPRLSPPLPMQVQPDARGVGAHSLPPRLVHRLWSAARQAAGRAGALVRLWLCDCCSASSLAPWACHLFSTSCASSSASQEPVDVDEFDPSQHEPLPLPLGSRVFGPAQGAAAGAAGAGAAAAAGEAEAAAGAEKEQPFVFLSIFKWEARKVSRRLHRAGSCGCHKLPGGR